MAETIGNLPKLQPMDIVVLSGKTGYPWYKWFAHRLITWRSLEDAVHCLTIKSAAGDCWSPEFSGLLNKNLAMYKGYTCTIHRYTPSFDKQGLAGWCEATQLKSHGYDFWRQWVCGYVLGILKSIANDETRWTCSELPYWAFQSHGLILTAKDELLPMPRLFRYSTQFTKVFEGVL